MVVFEEGLRQANYNLTKGFERMKRTKKSLKLDRAKIAIFQEHERDYLKEICREQVKQMESKDSEISFKKLKRICKALLKVLNRIK